MKPCCLKVNRVSTADDCQTGPHMISGAAEFNATSCPHDAMEAAHWISAKQAKTPHISQTAQQPLSLISSRQKHSKGCCYSIGYGARMKPCCLEATEGLDATECENGRRLLGGAKEFNETGCPHDADEASEWITAKQASDAGLHVHSRTSPASASTTMTQAPAKGCCYSLGYGALMKPCCLQTIMVPAHQCKMGNRLMGGASGFSATRCPQDAAEAAKWMKHSPEEAPGADKSEQETPVSEVHDESDSRNDLAVPIGIVCTFLLVGAAIVSARNVRTGRGRPLLERGLE